MIIRSKFTDYYDFIARQNRDEKVIYDRKPVCHGYDRHYKHWENKDASRLANTIANRYCWQIDVIKPLVEQCGIGIMLLCGKAYPFSYDSPESLLSFQGIKAYSNKDVSKSDVERFTTLNYENPYALREAKKTKLRKTLLRWVLLRSNFEKIEPGTELPEGVKLCRLLGPVVLLAHYVCVSNVPLRLVRLPVDPYTAFQDISSFLMSVEPYIPEMDDATKLGSHGFDEKTFKREPGGPTRKRKKLK